MQNVRGADYMAGARYSKRSGAVAADTNAGERVWIATAAIRPIPNARVLKRVGTFYDRRDPSSRRTEPSPLKPQCPKPVASSGASRASPEPERHGTMRGENSPHEAEIERAERRLPMHTETTPRRRARISTGAAR